MPKAKINPIYLRKNAKKAISYLKAIGIVFEAIVSSIEAIGIALEAIVSGIEAIVSAYEVIGIAIPITSYMVPITSITVPITLYIVPITSALKSRHVKMSKAVKQSSGISDCFVTALMANIFWLQSEKNK